MISIGIVLDSPGSVFFVHKRVGLKGKTFGLIKFRTMRKGTHHLRAKLESRNVISPGYKVPNDPRVTRFGKFLRETYLDELPQLLNVLIGDMSLVGPRPSPEDEIAKYTQEQRKRLEAKPGMTCLWVLHPSFPDGTFAQWLRCDVEYIDGRSLWLDFYILTGTILLVLKRLVRPHKSF